MKFDFDTIVERRNQNSAKYDELLRKFGRDDVIPLWIADMDFQVAKPIRDAIAAKNDHGIFGYVYRPDSYFEAVVEWQKKRNNWKIDSSLCSFNTSVVSAIYSSIQLFSNPEDDVLFLSPAYSEFYSIVNNAGRNVVTSKLIESDGTYTIDYDDFEEKLKQGPRIFILCNPHNPLGRVWTKDELTKISELCQRYNVLVISDEIHSDLILWGNQHIPFASLSEYSASNTITCMSTTKTFNMAGLQAATTLYPNQHMKATSDLYWSKLEQSRNNCFSVVAMEAALRHGEEWLEELIYYLEKNMIFVKNFIDENLPSIKVNVPESTYLMWLDFRDLNMDEEVLWDLLVNKALLGLGRGTDFGADPGFMRLNVACPISVLEKALNQLKDALND